MVSIKLIKVHITVTYDQMTSHDACSLNYSITYYWHRYFNYAKERVCDHKMALISSMEATHLRSLGREDNLSGHEKSIMLSVQIDHYLKYFGVKLDYPSGTKWNLLI